MKTGVLLLFLLSELKYYLTSAQIENITSTIKTTTTDSEQVLNTTINSLYYIFSSTAIPKSNISNNATESIDDVHSSIYISQSKLDINFEEKLEQLSCDLPLLPHDYRIWKGNETHELLLPLKLECYQTSNSSLQKIFSNNTVILNNCSQETWHWEGAIEIQSGDVLLVHIDDSYLIQSPFSNSTNEKLIPELTTTVYQVTRTGYENCDVTEGVLLDITPLKVDNQKVVTLYDKDLTLGINLLIVVSEQWGNQCVRLKVTVKADNCGENENCSTKGVCYSNNSMDGYECQCCLGYVGQHCEEQDACYPSPCQNNGICVDISQGHEGSTFQCLCPYGFTGKTCEKQINPCTSMPCENGATCVQNLTQFKCECAPGYSGSLCQYDHNDCESSPCVHGICVDQQDGYACFCQFGYTGTHCEYEYNECESSPCINGGVCTDGIGRYTCVCGRGFAGKRCQIKINLCEPNPCTSPRYCIDHGNNYSCECPSGFSGANCIIPTHTACSANPCINGGTCWSNRESFYCACKPGYTGKICDEVFMIETVPNIELDNTDLNLQIPVSIHLTRTHNLYIAVGTLACALVIVGLIVTACHCKVNKICNKIFARIISFFGCRKRSASQSSITAESDWFSVKDKTTMSTPNRSVYPLDTTDMYYTLDFSENQNSPLIQ